MHTKGKKVDAILDLIDEGLLYGCIHSPGRTRDNERVCVLCGLPWVRIGHHVSITI